MNRHGFSGDRILGFRLGRVESHPDPKPGRVSLLKRVADGVATRGFGVSLEEREKFDRLYGRVSARVSHITATRLDLQNERKRCDPAGIHSRSRRTGEFVRSGPPEKRGPALEGVIAQLLGEFDRFHSSPRSQ